MTLTDLIEHCKKQNGCWTCSYDIVDYCDEVCRGYDVETPLELEKEMNENEI